MPVFCPKCGCNLEGDEVYCPECGNILREIPEERTEGSGTVHGYERWVFFAVGFILMLLLTLYVGVYFLFFFIPVMFGGRQGRFMMLFSGAMLGTCIGLILKMLF